MAAIKGWKLTEDEKKKIIRDHVKDIDPKSQSEIYAAAFLAEAVIESEEKSGKIRLQAHCSHPGYPDALGELGEYVKHSTYLYGLKTKRLVQCQYCQATLVLKPRWGNDKKIKIKAKPDE